MWLLARFVQRGGHPAAVAPTARLRSGEKQYGAFPVDTLTYSSDGVYAGGGVFWSGGVGTANRQSADTAGWQSRGRLAATVTSERLILGDGTAYEFRDLIMVQPNPLDWSVNLYFQGTQPVMLRGPWIPWMTVVVCAELYGSPWPPGHLGSDLPATAVR